MNKSNTKTNEKCPLEGELDSGDLLACCPKGRIYKIGERGGSFTMTL